MSSVTYGRFADQPPPERELLTVDDGGWATAWRSIAPVGGRFAGHAPDVTGLRALVAAAAAAPDPEPARLPPDAVREEVEVDGRTAILPLDNAPAGPWADLAAGLRAVLAAVSGDPGAAVAAVGAVLAADGGLRLEHRGSESLTVELASLSARMTLWRDGAVAWSGPCAIPGGLDRTAVGRGWSMDLAPKDAVPGGPGILVAEVHLVADDGGVFVPLTLTASVER